MKVKSIKTIQEAQELAQVWIELDGSQHYGTLTPAELNKKSASCRQWLDTFTALSAQLQEVRAHLSQEVTDLSKNNGRVYQGMRASYGAKSPEYVRAQKTRIYKTSSRRASW